MDQVKKYKRIIIHCVLIFVALFLVLLFAKKKYFDIAAKSYMTKAITQGEGNKQALTEESGILTQKFTVTTDTIWGLGLSFERHQEKPQGEITINVTDESGKQLCQATAQIGQIKNNETFWLPFGEIIETSKGKIITLELQVKDIAKGDSLDIFVDEKGDIKIQQIYDQNTYLHKMFWLFAIAMILFAYGMYFLLYFKKCSIELIFLLFMLFAGMMYAFLIKPGAVPDEDAHYRTAYAHSNVLMGKVDKVRTEILMDDIDYIFYQTTRQREPNLSMYRDFQTDFLRRATREQMAPINQWPVNAPPYLYIGQTIGITLGRLLGFNGLTTFYLGRFFHVLVFALLAFWAMKKLPFYKMTLFALCLFPMTAHLIGSYSYDGMILAISLVLIAHIMSLAFDTREKSRWKEFAVIAIAGILLGGCKGGAYIPLIGLLLLIPERYFKERKQKAIFGGSVAIGTLAMFALGAMPSVSSSVGATTTWVEGTAYNVGWVLENPLKFIQLITNTLAEKSGFIFNSLVGTDLGWFNVPVSNILILGFFGIFMISCIYVREEPLGSILPQKQKNVIGICLLVSVAMITAGMMFSWTPMGSPVIEGLQGRYFLPLLLPLAFCLRNKKLTLQKSFDKNMIFMLAWLHMMVFISVLGATFIASA